MVMGEDERNTDNAWLETEAFWFHFETGTELNLKSVNFHNRFPRWQLLSGDFGINQLPVEHTGMIVKLFKTIWDDTKNKSLHGFGELSVPLQVEVQVQLFPKEQSTIDQIAEGLKNGSLKYNPNMNQTAAQPKKHKKVLDVIKAPFIKIGQTFKKIFHTVVSKFPQIFKRNDSYSSFTEH